LTVSQLELNSFQIPTTMSDSKSMNTSWLEVILSSKNRGVFNRDLSDLTRQIIFDAWWASINVGSKRPIAWSNSRHAPWWRFYFHCGIEETRSPGIIGIICHQVLCHPSDRDQLHGETLAGHSADCKLKSINRVGGFWMDQCNRWWDRYSHVEETRQLCRQKSKFAKEIHLRQLDLTYINPIDRQNALTWQQWTTYCQISPKYLESPPHVRICFGSQSLECYIKPRAATVILHITCWACAAIRQHPLQHLLERILTFSGCNWEAIAIKR